MTPETQTHQPAPDAQGRHSMQCMEVWGGNHSVDTGVSMPGIDAWVYSEPFERTNRGGDVHYMSSCATGRIARILLADVAGHGDDSSDLALQLRDLMRRYINRAKQSSFVNALNRAFCEQSEGYRFATGIAASYWGPESKISVSIAGHPLPLLYKASADGGAGAWSLLGPSKEDGVDTRNLPLGVDPKARFDDFDVTLEAGDVILFYTDALIETSGADGKILGEEGLLDEARKLDPSNPGAMIAKLREVIDPEVEKQSDADDVTLMALRCNGQLPKTTPLTPIVGMKNWVKSKVGGSEG